MREQPELWAALLPLLDLFDDLHVPYYVGGSVASSFVGIARATQDVDVVADLRRAHGPLLTVALKELYYVSQERVAAAIRRRESFNLIHLETAFKVDVFVLPDEAFARQAMTRRVALEVPDLERTLDFCSPEDVILSKLRWYEMGHRASDRQWYDLQGVLRLQGKDLDREHLSRWARELDLEPLLERALAEAGLDPPASAKDEA